VECCPVATQNDSETHETAARLVALASLGLSTRDHPSPCQSCTNPCGARPLVVPTAAQKAGDEHETPARTSGPEGPAPAGTRHARPSHTSVSPRVPPAVKWLPTAAQNISDTQETPVSTLRASSSAPVGRMCQAAPSHRSASVWPTSPRKRLPTATQK